VKTLAAAVLMIALVGCKHAQPPNVGKDYFYADQGLGQNGCPDDMQTILPSHREMREKDVIYHVVLCQPDSLGGSK
jgi:hypothetical protein